MCYLQAQSLMIHILIVRIGKGILRIEFYIPTMNLVSTQIK